MLKYFLLLITALSVCTSACRKKEREPLVCNMAEATDAATGRRAIFDVRTGQIYSYNDGMGNTRTFWPKDEMTIIVYSKDSSLEYYDSVLLNEQHMIAEIYSKPYNGQGDYYFLRQRMKYNGAHLESITTGILRRPAEEHKSTIYFTWERGNIKTAGDIEYFYDTTKPFAPGEYLHFQQITSYGALYMQNTHAVSGYRKIGSSAIYQVQHTYDGGMAAMRSGHVQNYATKDTVCTQNVKYLHKCE